MRPIAVELFGLIAVGLVLMVPLANCVQARPAVPRLEAPSAVEPVRRCPTGLRKSTITGRCVKSQFRLPLLNWFAPS